MGVTRGQAEQAGETRETSTASVQVRVDKEEYISLRWAAAYWKARHREAVRREVDLKATMKSCGLAFVSWKAVCTVVEASVGRIDHR